MSHILENKLKAVFGNDIYISVDIIHNDTDICIRCRHREVLYAIQEYFTKQEIFWDYKENILGKALILKITFYKTIEMNKDEVYSLYKKYYVSRINKIIHRCTDPILQNDYQNMINEPFNLSRYFGIRERMNDHIYI